MTMGVDLMTTASALWVVALLFIAASIKVVATAFYNVYLHPLSRFKGPKLAAATPIPYVIRLINGHLFHWTNSLHVQYGDIVRINPDELSFAKPSAWHDIYESRPQLPKPTLGMLQTPNEVKSLITASSIEDHDRMKKVLVHAFSNRALREQEPILQAYTNDLISQLQKQIRLADGGFIQIDVGDWFNYTAFDTIGDLCFGESFHSLENSEYHPWVQAIPKGVKYSMLMTVFDYFGPARGMVKRMLPNAWKRKAREHSDWGREKIEKRIQKNSDRPDFITYILQHNHEKGMTREEVESTVNLLVFAGSDTAASTSCSSIWFLLKNPSTMGRLQTDIRTAFETVEDITLAAVSKLPYLHAVLLEAMRIHPNAPINMPREVNRPGTIICGQEIPIGTRVGIPAKVANRLPQYFVEPLSFLPERWLEDADPRFASDEKRMAEPFMVGPRNCIGKNLGWAQMKLMIAKMIWSFDIQLASNNVEDWEDQKIWLFHERVPLNLRVSPRA